MIRNLWVVGTSVSIECGGYIDRLRESAGEHGFQLINLSVGDQTSLMGCMRILDRLGELRREDAVVWEYSLLDQLLGPSKYCVEDVRAARRLAWARMREKGVGLVVLQCPSRESLGEKTPMERESFADAASVGASCVHVGELMRDLKLSDPASHFRDDRHLVHHSPVIELMAERVLAAILAADHELARPPENWKVSRLRWLSVGDSFSSRWLSRKFSNTLVTIDALELAVGEDWNIPPCSRVVAFGVVSCSDSGAAWCGHPECPPASTTMPDELDYPFLLRTTSLPCVRGDITRVVSAPDWAFGDGVWRSYGHALTAQHGPLFVFGALLRTIPRVGQENAKRSRWSGLVSAIRRLRHRILIRR